MSWFQKYATGAAGFVLVVSLQAQPFSFPTANTNLYRAGGEGEFFTPTANPSVEPDWMSGSFGCVRNSGSLFHEGVDIRALEHDRAGEPVDVVRSIADGVVLYVSANSGASNYGKYILVGHRVNGLDVVSVYAHLRTIGDGVRAGLRVRTGDPIGVLGRTANTRSGISKDRAHLHLEIALFMNKDFDAWYRKQIPGAKNDHGMFSGLNLAGLDPRMLYLEQKRLGYRFNLVEFVQSHPELCRVRIRKKNLNFTQRYQALVETNPAIPEESIAGYEVVLAYTGTPVKFIPLTAEMLSGRPEVELISVDETVQKKYRCRKLVTRSGSKWRLAANGEKVISLLMFRD